MGTLSVPELVTGGGTTGFRPASVLLLLAGTGVVALPQILHHRDPLYKLGVPTPRWRQLQVPIDAVLSFRQDDVLCVPQIKEFCLDGKVGLRNCTVLITGRNTEQPPAFPNHTGGGDAAEAERELHGLENARILRGRLNTAITKEAIARMPQPCRVVVSGPDGFNSAAQEMLLSNSLLDKDQITVLSA